MILPAGVGELGLQEELVARDDAVADAGGDRLTDGGFVVVLALIGCVDGAKSGAERLRRQRRRPLLLPRGSVEEGGDVDACDYLRARSQRTSRSPNLPPLSAALTLSARSSETMR